MQRRHCHLRREPTGRGHGSEAEGGRGGRPRLRGERKERAVRKVAQSGDKLVEEAKSSGGSGDVKILYNDKSQLVRMCKMLGLMEDLKAGVPRTAYKGVITLRLKGRRVFLAPSYHVDQDITVR